MLVIHARLLLVDPPTNIAVKLAESLHSLASAVGIFHSHVRLVKFSFPISTINDHRNGNDGRAQATNFACI